MYTHTPMVLQQMSQHFQHQSNARIRVPSGPFGLAEQKILDVDSMHLRKWSEDTSLQVQ